MDAITIRASSLSDLLDCPARWESKHVRGMRMPSSPKAILGKAVHASTARFDLSTMSGAGLTADEAAGAAVDVIQTPQEDVDWKTDEISPATAEKIALGLHRAYCSEIAPGQDYLGVEVTCEALTITDLGLTLTGTTDRVRRVADCGVGIADIKTGATAVSADGKVKTAGHGVQLAVYELLAGNAIGRPMDAPAQIIGMQTGKTAKGQRVAVGECSSGMTALLGDEGRAGLLQHASRLIHSGNFFGNPRSQLCSEKYCPAWRSCHYRA